MGFEAGISGCRFEDLNCKIPGKLVQYSYPSIYHMGYLKIVDFFWLG